MRIRTLTIAATAFLGVAASSTSGEQISDTGKYNVAGSLVAAAFLKRSGHAGFGEGTTTAGFIDAGDDDALEEGFGKINPRHDAASITTTSYDEQSQTVVTRTLPATDLIARPSCDADDGASTNPAATAVTFSTTIPKHETDMYSYQPVPTWTYSGAAARNGWLFPRMAGAATTTTTALTATEPAASSSCATDAVTFTANVKAALQKFPPGQLNGTLRLTNGALFDQTSRMAFLGNNQEIMLDAIKSRDEAGADQWSVCGDGRLMYDGNGVWCSCQSGSGTHIFQSSQYCMRSECELVQLSAVSATVTPTTSEVTSTSTVTAIVTTTIPSCPIFSDVAGSSASTTPCSESSAPPTSSSVDATSTTTDTTSLAAATGMRKMQASEVVVSITVVLTKTVSPVAGGSTTLEASDASIMPSGTMIPVILSKDGKCGSSVNQTCLTSSFGSCCSKQGMCGDSAEFCDLASCDTNFLYSNCSEPTASYNPISKRAYRTVSTETIRETLTVTVDAAKGSEPDGNGTASSHDVATALQILTTEVTVTSTPVVLSTTQITDPAPPGTVLATAVNSVATVINNPLLPNRSSTMSNWSALNPHINNTSIDTDSYLDISTFSVSGQPIATSSASTTGGETSASALTSTHVTRPSDTAAGTTNNALVPGFTPAATSNVGKNTGSSEMAPSGMVHVCAAGATLLAFCFGVMVWL
ncbi:hypothetical protein LTR78_007174 [Recurvomyces mirabilis]|uniref:Chitin-binding type-1 domain-containing protein n=1 Tax=Recurvomyces mirabilis TaxID=574656 RepID=A0AAE0WJX5_9PEZI|nr:hypothetical protein LTR78_007174 [Recurvomyces mirabilis]KAK5150854.1 hypothetical protein LTS14_009657 [Recurvomyces mirabilis]